jgi:hypothetical protein
LVFAGERFVQFLHKDQKLMRFQRFLIAALAVASLSVAAADEVFPGFEALRADRQAAAKYMLQHLEAYWKADPAPTAPLTAKIVYFHAGDRQPLKDYDTRINGWMADFEMFYRAEFKRNGFGEHELALERTPEGRVKIHVVKGQKPDVNPNYKPEVPAAPLKPGEKPKLNMDKSYNYGSGNQIRIESAAALKSDFDLDNETALIICALSCTDDKGKINLYAPFYGIGLGSNRKGACLCVDHELLDVKNFPANEPRIEILEHKDRVMSLGEFNTTYLGGALHEFGHGLSLPHDHETADERALGTPLMGAGNYTYRQETRDKNRKGTYLSFSEAVRLISNPLFCGHNRDLLVRPRLEHKGIAFTEENGRLVIRGQLESDIPAYAVIAYNDDAAIDADYDAQTWTSVVNEKGEFEIVVGGLRPGKFELRLTACHMNGATTPLWGIPNKYTHSGKGQPLQFEAPVFRGYYRGR